MTCLKRDFNDNSDLMPQTFEGNMTTKVCYHSNARMHVKYVQQDSTLGQALTSIFTHLRRLGF